MSNKVYVGNLPYSFTNEDLRALCAAFGAVRVSEVVLDRTTNRSRGFGFVEMESSDGLLQVIRNLHDTELQGRRLNVTEARERSPGAASSFPRSSPGPHASAGPNSPRPTGGGGVYGNTRSSGGVGGGPSRGAGGRAARGGGAQRGGGRPGRDEGDRWSDGGRGGRRRRRDDDIGDE